ncbi:MAG: hydrogenase maturation protease [Sedimentisphaerales bacterium]|jgi:hydrogenase maturation protease
MTNQSPKKDTIVIGLGNILMSDESIGIHLIRRLSEYQGKYPCVEFIDAGTGGMNILHLIANRKKAVIIDCVKMGKKPGAIKQFEPADVKTTKKMTHFSLHEADILRIIELSKQLGECPNQIVIFGIEPESLELGQKLSKTLAGKIDTYLAGIRKELY